jgi:hypothetical protein
MVTRFSGGEISNRFAGRRAAILLAEDNIIQPSRLRWAF